MQIMKVNQCGEYSKLKYEPHWYKEDIQRNSNNYYREISDDEVAIYASKKFNEAWIKDFTTHEANIEAIENNKLAIEAIVTFMTDIGIPSTWSERDEKSRKAIKPWITHVAGYEDDIKRNVKIWDGFSQSNYDNLKKKYEKYASDSLEKAALAEKKKEQEEADRLKKRMDDIELAKIIVRYGFDNEYEWDNILLALRYKDQRLNLAIAMRETRADWNEGYYRVKDALDEFTVKNEEDQEIYDDVSSYLEDEDVDGRVFRDCEWNYNRLFDSIADQQLVKDASLALNNAEDIY